MTQFALAVTFLADQPEGLLRWWWLALILFLILAFLILFFTRKSDRGDQPVQMAHHSSEDETHVKPVEEAAAEPESEAVRSAAFEVEPESLFSTPAAVVPETEPIEERGIDVPLTPIIPVEMPPALVPDDLKLIEGIGPKIDGLLKAAGISTFAELAATDVSRLRELLGDGRFRIADPTTWPEQAALAAEGKLDELKALQDRLNAGRKA
ncbi:MAG: hypothetical protein JW987_09880 [Anaerolineaceae bacterium]|nr:hypothetical protein [Anaerolineaceae bacterium]